MLSAFCILGQSTLPYMKERRVVCLHMHCFVATLVDMQSSSLDGSFLSSGSQKGNKTRASTRYFPNQSFFYIIVTI